MDTSNRPVVNAERPFDVRELFFSTTDRKGVITACNDVFVRVSGYPADQLLGRPHNVVRHPHMPRCVFQLLWDHLLAGREIGAYVKNRAADGTHYWVYAVATPIDDGFLSVRVKPTSDVFASVPALYAELLGVEAEHGADRRAGMRAAAARLGERLAGLGFVGYDEFMTAALKAEVRARDRQVSAGGPRAAGGAARAAALDDLRARLSREKAFLDEAVWRLGLLSLNAAVGAAHTGEAGRTLAVVAGEITRVSGQIRAEIPAFGKNYEALGRALDAATFSAATARLQDEMGRLFRTEEAAEHLPVDHQVRRHGRPVQELIDLLAARSAQLVDAVAERVETLRATLGRFGDAVEMLSKVVKTLRFAHATGKVEAAGVDRGGGFAALLDDLGGLTDELSTHLHDLRTATARGGDALDRAGAAPALSV